APSVRSPAGEPLSVIVRTPKPSGPKAPESCCTQSGHVPFPSVQSALEVHALDDGWSQVPVPMPVQQRKGAPVPVQSALRGHPFVWSPSKQSVAKLPLKSRQKPQKTLFWPLAVLFTAVLLIVPVVSDAGPDSVAIASRSGGGGQSWLVG